ncbi:unnamed protein product [Prunus armeniaca]|uniref:Uncharacterized protein n=1 Tax=Prunus armeniaca TaxID=36596 RepID=A0A6J5TJ70_PRUAR|nr:unnamed protein product [Prunus armeniaca]
MSMFEIGLMVKELGYDGIVLYHYELPNSASVEKLMSDEDVLKMCECVPGVREINTFLTQLADDPYTFSNKHKQIELQMVEGSGVQKQRSVMIEDIGCADSIPLVPYNTKSNVEQPTNAKDKTVKIVEQEPVKDVGDFLEPEAPKNAKGKIVKIVEQELVEDVGDFLELEAPKNAKGKTVKIVDQELVEDVGDFLEPEAPKNAKGKTMAEEAKKGKGKIEVEAPKKGKAARSSKDKEVAEPEPPKNVRAIRSSKGKEVAEPVAPKRARATRSSKGKGVAMASATEGEDSDASLSDASSFVDSEYGGDNIEEIAKETIFLQQWITNHAPVEDTFQPLEDEEINEGEDGAVNEGGVVNDGEGPSGDQPLHAGPSGDHPSQTSQNEEQLSQTGQNREQPSQTTDFHHTNLQDTRLE